MTGARSPLVAHITTTDISLELLLGSQLEAFAAAGFEVIGVSAPGPYVAALERRGIRHVPLRQDPAPTFGIRRGWGLLIQFVLETRPSHLVLLSTASRVPPGARCSHTRWVESSPRT